MAHTRDKADANQPDLVRNTNAVDTASIASGLLQHKTYAANLCMR